MSGEGAAGEGAVMEVIFEGGFCGDAAEEMEGQGGIFPVVEGDSGRGVEVEGTMP